MKSALVLLAGAILVASPAHSTAPPTPAVAESTQSQSSVSVVVEPALSDGRLVLKVAAKNQSGAPVPFGPSAVRIAKLDGRPIPTYPLQSLIDDVRAAAGMAPEGSIASAPTQGAYAAPQQTIREGGQMDVTGYTGGAAVGGDEYVRRTQPRRRTKPSISEAEAQQQIAVLKAAILQDSSLGPNQVAAGQVVSAPLQLKKGEDRTLHLHVRVGSDDHSFTIKAPEK